MAVLSARRPTSVLGSMWPSPPPMPAPATGEDTPGNQRPFATNGTETGIPGFSEPTSIYAPPASTPQPYTGPGVASSYMAPTPTTQAPYIGIDPNQALYDARNRVLQARSLGLDANGNVINARAGVLGANGNVLAARGRYNQAGRAVTAAQAGLIGPETAVLNQNRNVLALRNRYNQQTGGYLSMQQAENAQQLAEEQALQRASQNVGDITAVALQRQDNQAEDARDAALGVSAPIDVNLPAGTAGLPGGVRAAPRTQAQYLQEDTTNARTLRNFNLQAAHLALQQTGNDVEAAQLVADELGLDVDHARLLVEQARNEQAFAGNDVEDARLGSDYAGLNEDYAQLGSNVASLGENRAQLDYERAQQPPQAGYVVYTDPETGQGMWVTPAERERRQYEDSYNRETQRIPQQYAQNQRRTQYQNSQNPMAAFDESDFVAALETNPANAAQVLAELVRRYGPEGANIKMAQLWAAMFAARDAAARRTGGSATDTPIKPPAARGG